MDSVLYDDKHVVSEVAGKLRVVKRLRIALKIVEEYQNKNLEWSSDLLDHTQNHISKRTWESTAGRARRILAERCEVDLGT